jgi:hypothetical protein
MGAELEREVVEGLAKLSDSLSPAKHRNRDGFNLIDSHRFPSPEQLVRMKRA